MTEHQTNGDAREAVEERGPRAKGPSRAELIQKLDELQAQLEQTQAPVRRAHARLATGRRRLFELQAPDR